MNERFFRIIEWIPQYSWHAWNLLFLIFWPFAFCMWFLCFSQDQHLSARIIAWLNFAHIWKWKLILFQALFDAAHFMIPLSVLQWLCFSLFCLGLIFCLTRFAISFALHRLSSLFFVCVRSLFVHRYYCANMSVLFFARWRTEWQKKNGWFSCHSKTKKWSNKCSASAYIINAHQSHQIRNVNGSHRIVILVLFSIFFFLLW